jgi:hypothetical protein
MMKISGRSILLLGQVDVDPSTFGGMLRLFKCFSYPLSPEGSGLG